METHWGYQSGAGSPFAYPGTAASHGAGSQSSTDYNEELLHKVQASGWPGVRACGLIIEYKQEMTRGSLEGTGWGRGVVGEHNAESSAKGRGSSAAKTLRGS